MKPENSKAILGGLIGTVVMTLMMMYLAPMMGLPKMDIIGMLGSMFTSNKGTATILGLVTHFMMGGIFAIIYALLWSLGIGSPTWLWGLIYGVVHGVVAIVTMPWTFTGSPTYADASPPGSTNWML